LHELNPLLSCVFLLHLTHNFKQEKFIAHGIYICVTCLKESSF
jgi:hypothetical protein